MSYITDIKGEEVRNELIEKQNKILAQIRNIIGSKKFVFADAYKHTPEIGIGNRPYRTITKKYVYVGCFLQHSNNEDCTEYGAIIKKYPICYNKATGRFVDKVELDDLFISDLEKILEDIKTYLWWEHDVRMPKIKAEYEECEVRAKMFEKLLKK